MDVTGMDNDFYGTTEEDAEFIELQTTARCVAEETILHAVAENDIGPSCDSASGRTALAPKEQKGIEELYVGRFTEIVKFRLDGFRPSRVRRVLHHFMMRYRGCLQNASW
jgi:hypothetical protein